MQTSLKSGTCPKCDSQEIYTMEPDIHKILPHIFDPRGVGNRPSPVVDNYVCGNCGYAEFFVRPRHLATVKNNWDRLKPQ